MTEMLRVLALVALVPAYPIAAQSLPAEIVGHKIKVPGEAVEGTTAKLSEVEAEMVAALPPQRQAERLLQYAISHHVGATDEIKARVNGWRGAIKSTPAMATLLDVARNGADLRVRAAAIELDLATMNIAKTAAAADALLLAIDRSPKDARSEIDACATHARHSGTHRDGGRQSRRQDGCGLRLSRAARNHRRDAA